LTITHSVGELAKMCGIAGYYGSVPLCQTRIDTALRMAIHRGPDNQDFCQIRTRSGRHVVLLHSRLSIIDLDPRSNGPMEQGGNYFVFNGELYNYIEIRKRLKSDGTNFRTSSDTEVFFMLLCQKGIASLDEAEGMWAFGYFEKQTEQLIISRDRFGEKPLFFYRDTGGIYFASELSILFALMGWHPNINNKQIMNFLVNGYACLYKTGDGFFQGVEEVVPGTSLIVEEGGKVREERYWQLEFTPQEMSFEDAVKGTRERVLRAVELRLRADVPIAILLSGGVDSTSVAAIAKRIFDYDIHAFSIMNEDPRYDECDIIRNSVQSLGLRHCELALNVENFLDDYHRLISHYCGPISAGSYFANWMLFRELHHHDYRACLMGIGGDEAFTGYYENHLLYLAELYGTEYFDKAQALFIEHVKPQIRNPILKDSMVFIKDPDMRDHVVYNNRQRLKMLRIDFDGTFIETQYSDNLMRNRMMNMLFHEGVRINLYEADLNAMNFSIENRVPLLDRGLFEFAYSIPNIHMMRNGFGKAVFREAMRGISPDFVLDSRDKHSLNVPFKMLIGKDSDRVHQYLLSDGPIYDLVDKSKIGNILEMPERPNSWDKFLFALLGCKLFLEEFG